MAEVPRLHRASPADLEIRADGRTVVGLCVPFNQPADIFDQSGRYVEQFRRGAFSRTIEERASKVKFQALHAGDRLPLGRAVVLREDTAGLYGEFRVSKTVAGDEILELIRDGALDAMSIGFRPIRDNWSADRSTCERLEVRLDEVSAVTSPAYESAQIIGVRHEITNPHLSIEDALDRLLRFPHLPPGV